MKRQIIVDGEVLEYELERKKLRMSIYVLGLTGACMFRRIAMCRLGRLRTL